MGEMVHWAARAGWGGYRYNSDTTIKVFHRASTLRNTYDRLTFIGKKNALLFIVYLIKSEGKLAITFTTRHV